MKTTGIKVCLVLFGLFATALVTTQPVYATEDSGFSIQVTPSPLVSTLKPGQKTTLELKIYNSGTATVDLKIQARNFEIDSKSGEVKVDDTSPARVSDWVSFGRSEFRVDPGQWYTQTITVDVPKDAGYSYHFAVVISQENLPQQAQQGNRLLRGSVAVFTLLNVDRPGSTRRLEATELQLDKQVYEYLPANISVTFKNTGNTIVQPYGNIFVQRSHDDTNALATLPVNENKGYILPGSTRTLSTSWTSGFPQLVTDSDGRVHEEWDWAHVNEFRFGRYTVKLVGVYNDGKRDIPLEAEVSFWVIPWKILGGLLIVLLFVVIGVWSLLHKLLEPLIRRINRGKRSHLGLHD